jgi:hypothetical protein
VRDQDFLMRIEMNGFMHIELGSESFDGLKGKIAIVARLLETCDNVQQFEERFHLGLVIATEEAKQSVVVT